MRLKFLRPLYEDKNWFVSAYLDTSRAAEDAASAVSLRWRGVCEELSREGADPATLDAAGAVVTDPAMAAPCRAVFARAGSVPFTASAPEPPARQIARWARLPDLLPLLARYPPKVPQVLVSASRSGGEVLAVRGADNVLGARVDGHGWPVHKASAGGLAQKRFERTTEEAWDENARELAAVVADAASRAGAEAVVVAGDVRARSLLVEKLPAGLRDSSVVVDRELSVASGAMADAADEAVAAITDLDCRTRLAAFRDQLGTGRAVEGIRESVAALRDGQVAELFVSGDGMSPVPAWSSERAWVGPQLADIAMSAEDLAERGVDDAAADSAGAAVVRALAGTDAGLYFVPEGEQPPQDGIGALLRYAAPGG